MPMLHCPRSATVMRCLLIFVVTITALPWMHAQHEGSRASAEQLTQTLMRLNGEYQSAPAASRPGLLLQITRTARQRQQVLSTLMMKDPGQMLRVAMPAQIASTLPRTASSMLEQETDAVGELEVSYEDGPAQATLHHFLVTPGQRLELKFAAHPPQNLVTGTRVHVHGTRLGNALALSSGNSTGSFQVVQAAVLANTMGAQNTLVMLVNFQDNASQPWTLQDAQNMMFGTVSNFWLQSSLQQTWISGDAAGWFTLPMSSTTCDTASIQTNAQAAAQAAGYVLSNYSHYVYLFPQITACGWSGYSTIGGMPSSSWINGQFFQQVINHELGHALGLYHSHSLSCGSVVYATSGCTLYEYGDYYDTMGNSSVNGFGMDYNAFQKERLGWLNYSAQPPITTVTASGSYTIGPYETQDSSVKALKILQSGTSGTYYYVEFRQPLGNDSYLSNTAIPGYSQVANGVVVHAAAPGNSNSSDLLSMNPASTWGTAMALDAGQSYTDSAAGVTISTTAVNSAGATVQVTLSGSACSHANPTVVMSPAQSAWVAAGTTVSFTATVTNNDSAACAASTFNLESAAPGGWNAAFVSPALSLAPGATGSSTLQVTSAAGSADGFYNIAATATDPTAVYGAAASVTYVVSTPVPVSVSVVTDKTSYSSSQTVTVTFTVMSGSAPSAGTAVSISITPPKGGATLLSGVTGSNGSGVATYTLKKKPTTGTYQVTVSTVTGSAASASTSFSVK